MLNAISDIRAFAGKTDTYGFNAIINGVQVNGFRVLKRAIYPPALRFSASGWYPAVLIDREDAEALYEALKTALPELNWFSRDKAIAALVKTEASLQKFKLID